MNPSNSVVVEVMQIKFLLDRITSRKWSFDCQTTAQFLGQMGCGELIHYFRPLAIFDPENEGAAERGRTVVLHTWNTASWDTLNGLLSALQGRHKGKPGIYERRVAVAQDAFIESLMNRNDQEFRRQSGSSAPGSNGGDGSGYRGLGGGNSQAGNGLSGSGPMQYQAAPPMQYQAAPPMLYQAAPPMHYQAAPPMQYQAAPPMHYQAAPPMHYQAAPPMHYQARPQMQGRNMDEVNPQPPAHPEYGSLYSDDHGGTAGTRYGSNLDRYNAGGDVGARALRPHPTDGHGTTGSGTSSFDDGQGGQGNFFDGRGHSR